MKTLKEQTEEKVQSGRTLNPEFMQGVDEIIAQAKSFQTGAEALNIGQKIPSFTLPDANGDRVSSALLLAQGPLVVTFYRGSWCPYCSLQLRALQAQLSDFNALGAKLLAISPQVPDDSVSDQAISELGFSVLSDQSANVAQQFGVAWQVPTFLTDHMRHDRKLDLEAINNGNANILPIPATFVVNQEGKITWRYVDVDYRTRSEPSDIIEALKAI